MRLAALLAVALAAPLAAQPVTLAPSDARAFANFGATVAVVPDLSGDGVDDLAVGMPNYDAEDGAAIRNDGRIDLFSGADGTFLRAITAPVGSSLRLGSAIAGLPDIDGDGVGDLLVGISSANAGEGGADIYSGATGALLRTLSGTGAPAFGLGLGLGVARVPDATGDGIDDYLLSTPLDSDDPEGEGGAVGLFSGGPIGGLVRTIHSPNAQQYGAFGASVAGIGDVNGDGRGDAVVGAAAEDVGGVPYAGRVYILSGLDGATLLELEPPTPQEGARFGGVVAVVADANGDGVADVAVGAPNEDVGLASKAGRAYLFSGADGALLATFEAPTPRSNASFGGAISGTTVAGGAGAVVVGSQFEAVGGISNVGRAYVFRGSDGALVRTLDSPAPTLRGYFGSAVAGLGADIVVGAPSEDSGPFADQERSGVVYVFDDGATGADVTASVTLQGPEGWRLLSAPVSVDGQTLFADLYTQGVHGGTVTSGDASVYTYDEAAGGALEAGFAAADLRETAVGAGYAVYVFEDDDPLTAVPDGGFPKDVEVTGPEVVSDVGLPVTFTDTGDLGDDGWNLVGNPFPDALDWDHPDWTKTNVDDVVYVYDPADQTYTSWNGTTGSLGSGVIAPFQGFWVKASGPPLVVAPVDGQTAAAPPVAPRAAAVPVVALRVEGVQAGQAVSDAVHLAFLDGAAPGLDRRDAFELAPFRPSFVALYAATEAAALDIAALPPPDAAAEVDLGLAVIGEPVGGLRLTWPDLALPAEWTATLVDRETGATVDLGAAGSYAFEADAVAGRRALAGPPAPTPLAARLAGARTAPRFAVRVARSSVASEGPADYALALGAPRPNPTGAAATLAAEVPTAGPAEAAVFDVLGRRVATLWDGPLPAGPTRLTLDAGAWPSGVYVVRLTAGGAVATRTFTVAH